MAKVQSLAGRKQRELDEKLADVDKRGQAMRMLAVDLAYLRKTQADLVAENEKMGRKITQAQNVDEVHIEIDVLAQTAQGLATLKDKYAKLMRRFDMEKKRYDALEKEYFKMEPALS